MGIRGWLDQRRQAREIERRIQARRGKAQIQRHIRNQEKSAQKLWELGKQALQLGDNRQFRQIGKHYLWTLQDTERWKRYLISFEAMEARRDQVRSMRVFMESIHAMSQSMLTSVSPKAMAETERDLELGIARAQNLEETLSYMMDMADETIFGMEEVSDEDFSEIQREMSAEAEAEEGEAFDQRIEAGLRRIREEMRKDSR